MLRAADMITELTLQEYKAHAATRIPLGKLTVLVGPNAVGKTSVLDALLLASRVIDEPDHTVQSVLTGKYDLRWLVRRGATKEMKIRVLGDGHGPGWEMVVTAPNDGVLDKVAVDWSEEREAPSARREGKAKALPRPGPGKARRPLARAPVPAGAGAALHGAVASRHAARRL